MIIHTIKRTNSNIDCDSHVCAIKYFSYIPSIKTEKQKLVKCTFKRVAFLNSDTGEIKYTINSFNIKLSNSFTHPYDSDIIMIYRPFHKNVDTIFNNPISPSILSVDCTIHHSLSLIIIVIFKKLFFLLTLKTYSSYEKKEVKMISETSRNK